METRIKNYVFIPRSIRDDYLNRKITQNEFNLLIWIWFNTNPINGFTAVSYDGLRQDLRSSISYANARKIISSLRTNHYIYFVDHKGKGGSFSVFPVGFLLSNKEIQTEDYIKNKLSITTQPQREELLNAKPHNNFDTQYHNLEEQGRSVIKHFSMNTPSTQITTSNNDNKTKTYKRSIIDIKNFSPKSYEEQKCWEIAKSLGEQDMSFILNRLKTRGIGVIERAWGIFKEVKRENINNPAAYFNKLISKPNKD